MSSYGGPEALARLRQFTQTPISGGDRCTNCGLRRDAGIHWTAEACNAWFAKRDPDRYCSSPAEHHGFNRPYYE